jgi:hypothetical protein
MKALTNTVVAILTVLVLATTAAVAAPTGVKATKIGNPTWAPADIRVFAAPVGTSESGFAEFLDTMLSILPAPQHQFHPMLGVGPGSPHPGPYDSEIAGGVEANGYQEGRLFTSSAVTGGNGVWLAFMLVPTTGAAVGSSPDSAAGPILSNALFPVTVTSIARHGSAADGPFSFEIPALDANLDPPFAVDGHSHVPVFLAESAEFFPGRVVQGAYDYSTTLIDASGNGWLVQAHVTVTP